MKEQVVQNKSTQLAIRIIRLYQYLTSTHKEYVLSKQVLRSGTSVGANVREAEDAQSRADFISKMSIALKEAKETEYWLFLLHETDYIDARSYASIRNDCGEVCRLLTAIVKTSRESQQKQ